MMQLAFPPLRSDTNLIAFNKKIEELDWDLNAWRADVQRRSNKSFQEGFDVLDASGGAGWDLLTKVRVRARRASASGFCFAVFLATQAARWGLICWMPVVALDWTC